MKNPIQQKGLQCAILIFIFTTISSLAASGKNTDLLLDSLDRVLNQSETFIQKKESRISVHKQKLKKAGLTGKQIFEINNQLAFDYKGYICDSVLSYYGKNMALARKNNHIEDLNFTRLNLAETLKVSGMYKETFDILESIDPASITDKKNLQKYYYIYYGAYSEIKPQYHDIKVQYDSLARHYRDLFLSVADPECDEALYLNELKMLDKNRFDEALKINDKRLRQISAEDPISALIRYHRAKIYQKKGDTEEYKNNLILSVIQDVRKATKDQASLRRLANQCFEEGDIDRADRYIKICMEDAQFYNAKLRGIYLSQSFPIINRAYKEKISRHINLLNIMIGVITLLLVLLAGITLSVIKHKRNLQAINKRLSELTQNLDHANQQLQTANDDLIESNYIKENYIARFLSMSSSYLTRIEKLSRIIMKKYLKEKTPIPKDLSEALTDNEMNEFYDVFDDSFLTIYPTFIDEFNKLMKDEGKIVIDDYLNKKVLNTELRVFALIRLGFDDCSSIAGMLRYSVGTIYNVRSQVKGKANVPRQDFEAHVKKISTY